MPFRSATSRFKNVIVQPVSGVLSTQKARTPGWDSQHLLTGEGGCLMHVVVRTFSLLNQVGHHAASLLLLGCEGGEDVASANLCQMSCFVAVPAFHIRCYLAVFQRVNCAASSSALALEEGVCLFLL